MQIESRPDCIACFSCNQRETWPFVTYGWTRPEWRVNVEGRSLLLQSIVSEYRKVKPEGGRLFITRHGVVDWSGEFRMQFAIL